MPHISIVLQPDALTVEYRIPTLRAPELSNEFSIVLRGGRKQSIAGSMEAAEAHTGRAGRCMG
ncbi:hypothetical protein EYF80_010546 [Liparis tanakae]|uniref:Uncharacterized protein n=1 Tax=Liparis tanakae TaxID=230148 RepID=A0A4Z2IND8_9TELE|nr:hypothetical protein EYF80_010546 [Liparis tanakae]